MVDVKHGALGAFEQDTFAGAPGIIEFFPGVAGVREDPGRDLLQLIDQGSTVDLGLAETAQQRIVMDKKFLDPGVQNLGLGQVGHADGAPGHLVLVGRPDAAPRGTYLGLSPGLLARQIEVAVERQDEGRVVCDAQVIGRDIDALGADGLDLVQQRPRIKHNAISDDRKLARAHHARRQKAHLVGDTVDDKGMAGVVAALKAHHHIGAIG